MTYSSSNLFFQKDLSICKPSYDVFFSILFTHFFGNSCYTRWAVAANIGCRTDIDISHIYVAWSKGWKSSELRRCCHVEKWQYCLKEISQTNPVKVSRTMLKMGNTNFISVISMLLDPNDERQANLDAAVMWRNDWTAFKK